MNTDIEKEFSLTTQNENKIESLLHLLHSREAKNLYGEHDFFNLTKPILRKLIVANIFLLARTFTRFKSLRRLCLPTPEPLLYLAIDQTLKNNKLKSLESSKSFNWKALNQLPCTKESLEQRVEYITKNISINEPILIIGDDDLQSLALARAGYKDITVVELDVTICDQIRKISNEFKYNIRVISCDIQFVNEAERRPFALCLIDPPCNISGAKLFIEGALSLTTRTGKSLMMLSTNLFSYCQTELRRLDGLIMNRQMEVLEIHDGFNQYPIPRIPLLLINILLYLVKPLPQIKKVRHFFSDLIVLRY